MKNAHKNHTLHCIYASCMDGICRYMQYQKIFVTLHLLDFVYEKFKTNGMSNPNFFFSLFFYILFFDVLLH